MVVGTLEVNCYVLADEPPQTLLIDPGADADEILACLDMQRLEPVIIFNTHGHADHIAANAQLRERYPEAKIIIGREDGKALTSSFRNMSVFMGQRVKSPPADQLLDDGEELSFARWTFKVIHVPGHTPGSICLFTEDLDGTPALFSGDTLFSGSVGRTDIPGGDWDTLFHGIRLKLLTLPGETVVYPGHGPRTTVAEEKAHNPFLK